MLEQAAQGKGCVLIPGGVQKMCRCSTSGYGLADMVTLEGWLDLMILEVFSNLCFYDSWHSFLLAELLWNLMGDVAFALHSPFPPCGLDFSSELQRL